MEKKRIKSKKLTNEGAGGKGGSKGERKKKEEVG